jgi:hypothetical protein
MSEPLKITHVYTFPNGMCMVFDQHGKQMPDYQGRTEEMLPKIRENFNGKITEAVWPCR